MVVIRLARVGAKKRPFYHVIAVDSRRARNSGNYIERLGYFNPIARGGETRLHLDHDRIKHWLEKGAQPSDRVHSLIVDATKSAAGIPTPAQKKKLKRTDKKAKAAVAAKAATQAEAKAQAEAEKAAAAAKPAETEAQEPAQEAEKPAAEAGTE